MTTGSQIKAALASVNAIGGQKWTYDDLAAGADDAMRQTGITTKEGAAVFIAQCMVESAYFRTTREYGGPNTRYAPYYGRGFIQVTWRDNYARFGAWCKARGLVSDANYFVSVPDRLADPKWAWLGAVWYFSSHRHGLVSLANKGENIKVGRAINRGDAHSKYAAYGEDHRQAAYRALLKAGVTPPGAKKEPSTPTPKKPSTPTSKGLKVDGNFGTATIKALQKHLKVTADGRMGTKTIKALQKWVGASQDGRVGTVTIKALQRKVGAKPVDGVWGLGTTKALQTWLNKH